MTHTKAEKRSAAKALRQFMATESAGGIVMMAWAVFALLLANSGASDIYRAVTQWPLDFGLVSLQHAVKDVLMVLFFLVVGLELKKELSIGFLSRRDQIVLPLCAAIGGMVVPAAIFMLFNGHDPAVLHGWAIPSATDIAFALAILSIFGRNVPPSVRIFLLAIAIFDDLGAILIIALFYSAGVVVLPLLLGAAGIAALVLLNRFRVGHLAPYLAIGIFLWFCAHAGGIHTTIAGVITGLAIPLREGDDPHHSPLNRCLHLFHPWVVFLVLPLFAFVSAGVDLRGLSVNDVLAPLPLGIALGLFLGKQIGILATSYGVVRLGLAAMPSGATWRHMYAVSVLAGIGFTMSLFIGFLAFSDAAQQEMVKIGVMAGSFLAILWAAVILRIKP